MYWYRRRMLYIKLSALALGLTAAAICYFIFC
jgi:hypothetical protein